MARFHRLLLAAYPAEIRRRHGDEIVAFWRAQGREARYRGRLGRSRLAVRLTLDAIAAALGRLSRPRENAGGSGGPAAPTPGGRPVGPSEIRAVVRSHLRHPALAMATTLSMAVGVGVATLMFTLVHALLLRPPDLPAPDELVRLTRDASGEAIFSYPEVQAIRAATDGLAEVTAHQVNEVVVRWGDEPPSTSWFELIEPDAFRTFGVLPSVGRGLSPDATREVVLSHGLWARLGRDPDVVGRAVRINGEPFAVVGVGPEGFRGALGGLPVELWLPLGAQRVALPNSGSLERASDRFLVVTGRLTGGATAADVQAAARRASVDGADRAWAEAIVASPAGGLLPLIQNGLRPIFGFLSIMLGVVVLIACVNVMGVMATRAAERVPEYSLRLALGASRGRLLRLALIDAGVLAVPGALAAACVAWLGTRAIAAAPLPADVPIALDPRLGAQAVTFAVLLTVASTAVAVVGPAWVAQRRAGKRRPEAATLARGARRARRLFVGAQVALASLLLAVSGLLGRGIRSVTDIDPGFRVEGVLTASASADRLGWSDDELRAGWARAVDAVRAVPGVRVAGAVLFAPMGARADRIALAAPGSAWTPRPVLYNLVTGGALGALGLEVVRGRQITDADGRSDGPIPVLVNETLAGQAYPDGEVLDRLLELGDPADPERGRVVGVVRDAVYRRLSEGPTPHVYLPFGRTPRGDMIVVAHTSRADGAALADVVTAVRATSADLVVEGGTMAEAVDASTFWSRIAATGTVTAGVGGLLLALVGLFGSVSYEATRRLRELAIRRALGASDARTRAELVAGSVRVGAVGVALGLTAAVGVGRLVRALLHGIAPHDPVTLAAVGATLLATIVLGAASPASRAVRTPPARLLEGG